MAETKLSEAEFKKELLKLRESDNPELNKPCITDYSYCKNCLGFDPTRKHCKINNTGTDSNSTCALFELKNNNRLVANALMVFNEDYIAMAEDFYKIQPFFYDKHKIFWIWEETKRCWVIADLIELLKLIQDNANQFMNITKGGVVSQIKTAIEIVGRGKVPKEPPLKWVQFGTQAYSLTSGKIYEVAPNYFFTNPIPWKIGEVSSTPTLDKLFSDWVGKESVATLYEIIAYCCYRDYPIQTLFCLFGSGRNGKSCFLRIIRKFIGSTNVISTELDRLCSAQNRFESFKLYKKLVCLMGETDFNRLDQSSTLKKLTGGDLIGYEKKGKDPFDDINYAKLIIASNSLPVSSDTSEGFYRRWCIIMFNNQFKEGRDIVLDIPEEEYSNLARKCVEILPELLKKGAFTGQGTIEERTERYIKASNPLTIFIRERCEVGDYYYMEYSKLYISYIQYLKKNKKRKVMRKEFKAVLEEEGFCVERTNKKTGAMKGDFAEFKSTWWVSGLKLC